MDDPRSVEFEVPSAALGRPVAVRLTDFGGRWVAALRCGTSTTSGLGATARDAFLAALAPLGARVAAALMVEPVMFVASARVNELEAAM
ncbi:MAG TPA: hypothetical protein VFH63_01960 [candidate division Zixibacteria bacterium]|nr:hypothetical protein [candidate division Zixibacteria bacterium]